MVDILVIPLLKIVILLNAVLVSVSYMTLLERKVIAWVQSRLGPMRVGPRGVLQPIADALKLMMKEDITPAKADKWVFTLAPMMVLVPALIVFAVIPFGPEVNLFGRMEPLYITDINVGLLYGVSVASLGGASATAHSGGTITVDTSSPAWASGDLAYVYSRAGFTSLDDVVAEDGMASGGLAANAIGGGGGGSAGSDGVGGW